eukprot:TRINITY_DN15802_c0_g1_i1.p1 TRINITY_DN15802_c0_g1~~TRINITY_DN15802_c0_g1_i1.p1  ORF type:complete len:504 (-),score=55.98 TRINITY_DN15802_c0_g1_i1:299-1810(-)
MGGTHWYHTHHHHSTALQAGGGAAGLLIVEDPTDYLPKEFEKMPEKLLLMTNHNMQDLQDIAQLSHSDLLAHAMDIANASGLPTNPILINGQYQPKLKLYKGEWNRFRICFSAIEQRLDLRIVGEADCSMKLLAKDGIYLHEFPRHTNRILLNPGARADVAVSCLCPENSKSCKAALVSKSPDADQASGPYDPPPFPSGKFVYDSVLMHLDIKCNKHGHGHRHGTPLPKVEVARPCYLVDLVSATPDTTGDLNLFGAEAFKVTWNGQGYSMTEENIHNTSLNPGGTMMTWPALVNFTVGTVIEFKVGNGIAYHPLHLHVNPYQIVGDADCFEDCYFRKGDWQDTVQLHSEMPEGTSFVARMQLDNFIGRMVVHCHILPHEDEGMMAWIDIQGEPGSEWAGAERIDSSCYRTYFEESGSHYKVIGTSEWKASKFFTDSSLRPLNVSIPRNFSGTPLQCEKCPHGEGCFALGDGMCYNRIANRSRCFEFGGFNPGSTKFCSGGQV